MARLKKFSVLLLYPDYMQESGTHDTYYAHVWAYNRDSAVKKAKEEAAFHNQFDEDDNIDDFAELLVLQGHRYGL